MTSSRKFVFIPVLSVFTAILLTISTAVLTACHQNDSDEIQQRQQEKILSEGTSEIGMPSIVNFRERRMLKLIFELRDKNGLLTYTYVKDQYTGKFRLLGQSIGYGIPYATQYTSPKKSGWVGDSSSGHWQSMPQADPNGLFSPSSADGTWVLMVDPSNPKNVQPIYVEQRVLVTQFKLSPDIVEQ